jgi:transcriptional antiterminator
MEDLIKIEIHCKSQLDVLIIQSLKVKHFIDRDHNIDMILDNTPRKADLKPLLGTFDDSDNVLDLSKVSHQVKHISNENGKYFGYIKIFDTPHGKILKEIIYSGVDICLVPYATSVYEGKLNLVDKNRL